MEPSESGGQTMPIDLVTAFRLAGAQSLEVAIFKERLEAAEADLDLATSRFLPDLQAGAGYVRHDGRLQETRGEVFDVSRSSLFAAPAVHLHADPTEAYFERLRALQVKEAVEHGAERTRAEAVVQSALLYLGLLEAQAMVGVARDAVEHSSAQTELSRRMVEVQAELRVNLTRARAALARDEQQLLQAKNNLRQASVELAVWLRLKPEVSLVPAEDRIQPLTFVHPDEKLEVLIDTAMEHRPDVRELDAGCRRSTSSRPTDTTAAAAVGLSATLATAWMSARPSAGPSRVSVSALPRASVEPRPDSGKPT